MRKKALTVSQVNSALWYLEHTTATVAQIARRFGVSEPVIRKIDRGEYTGRVDEDAPDVEVGQPEDRADPGQYIVSEDLPEQLSFPW